MPENLADRCIALAGLLQAVEQMQHFARTGECSDASAVDAVLESVLRIDAGSAEAVYGGVGELLPGLTALRHHLLRNMDVSRLEQARYSANLMFLERRLHATPVVAGQLSTAIQLLVMERAERSVSDPWMLERMASLYVDYVSPLGPRIMVSGEPAHLRSEGNAERIRSLLLAGVRAAVLWRQCGGRRWKLLVFRHAMLRHTETLLAATRP